MSKLHKPGDLWRGAFSTRSPGTGAKTAADSLPTAVLSRNGTDDGAVTVTVAQVGSTNRYTFSLTIPSSYASGDSLTVWASATVGGVQDTSPVEQTRLVTYSDIATPASGNVARAVPVTVRDTNGALIPNAHVRLAAGAQSFTADTGNAGPSLGIASFSIDDAAYTRSITAPGYSFTPDIMTVDAAHTAFDNAAMSINSIGAPTDPSLCRVFLNNYVAAATYTWEMTAAPGSPIGGYPIPLGQSDGAVGGQPYKDFPQASKGRVKRGNGTWVTFDVPAAGTYQVPANVTSE